MTNPLFHTARNPSLDRDRPTAPPRPECARSVNGHRAASLLQQAGTLPSEFGEAGTNRDAFHVAGAVFREPRFTDQPFPVRRPPVADASAPGESGPPPLDSPGAAHIGVDLGSGDYSVLTLVLSDAVMLSLRLSAAEAGLSEEQLISKLVAQHAAKIGIARLSEFQQGGEAVSRVAHNHDVVGSNPAPATSGYPESEEGREGVPSGAFPLPQGPP